MLPGFFLLFASSALATGPPTEIVAGTSAFYAGDLNQAAALSRGYVKQGKRAAALEELGRELAVMPSSAMALALRRQLGSEASTEPRQ